MVLTWVRVNVRDQGVKLKGQRPGIDLSQGQGIVVAQGGGTHDDVTVLRMLLQHLFRLLATHSDETPDMEEKYLIRNTLLFFFFSIGGVIDVGLC